MGETVDGASIELLGISFRPWNEQEVVEHVRRALTGSGDRRGGWIVTPNVDILRQLVAAQGLRDLISPATVVVADGMPLVWAGALQGTNFPERVTGASLIHSLCAAAADYKLSVYLLGGAHGVADEAARRLSSEYAGLRIDGWSPPYGLEATTEGKAEIRARLRANQAELVFCGFGFPKQERLIAELVDEFPNAWFVGCGASLTFAAGRIRRAPRWMQRCGLEWLHRLYREPRRMFRRYVVEDLPFALRLLAHAARHRSAPDRR
jgi:N-acetylglucosaminyldiphosphoundecaprenol N-acetyl-beta-D-mannosaminyltransferase